MKTGGPLVLEETRVKRGVSGGAPCRLPLLVMVRMVEGCGEHWVADTPDSGILIGKSNQRIVFGL